MVRPDDGDDAVGAGFEHCREHMAEHRAPCDFVQSLGLAGAHPHALAGGQHDGETGAAWKGPVLAAVRNGNRHEFNTSSEMITIARSGPADAASAFTIEVAPHKKPGKSQEHLIAAPLCAISLRSPFLQASARNSADRRV